MRAGSPSRTAWSAARYRAAHQLLEGGSIFKDDLAVRVSGEPETALLADAPRRGMRLFIAARHRFAEDALATAVSRGVRRAVVLGAGLDTFAYRNPYPTLSVTEVDHPDTQAWKRARLAEAGIEIPPNVTYLGIDFEASSLPTPSLPVSPLPAPSPPASSASALSPSASSSPASSSPASSSPASSSPASSPPASSPPASSPPATSSLTASSVSASSASASSLPAWGEPAFFLWLGVVPYLTDAAFTATLSSITGHEVVFDYAQSPTRASGERRAALEARASRVADLGEPWLSYFEPDEIEARLRTLGFTEIEDLGPSALAARYFGRTDVPPSTPGGHLLRAR